MQERAQGAARPEDELLLLLVQGRSSSDRETRVRALLAGSPDWAALIRQADVQGVLPLVSHHLQRIGSAEVPPAVRAELQRRAFLYGGRNLIMARDLRDLLQRLAAAGIPVIPLKGIALATALYGDCTLRVSNDIDLLVPRAQLPDAVRVLEAGGYAAEGPWPRWAAATYHIEVPLVPRGEGRRFPLDLQWGLVGGDPRYRRATEECWSAARPATVVGAPAWAMSPEWELLFLCLHAARSQWQGLKCLVDIQEIYSTWALDWERVRAIAERWRWTEILQLSLEACRRLWEPPPPHPFDRVDWPSWLPRFPAPPRETRWASVRVMALLLPGWRQRVAYGLRVIGTSSPNDYRWLPLPAALSSLYLVLRPLRWAVMGARWCLRTLAQRGQGGGVGSGSGSP